MHNQGKKRTEFDCTVGEEAMARLIQALDEAENRAGDLDDVPLFTSTGTEEKVAPIKRRAGSFQDRRRLCRSITIACLVLAAGIGMAVCMDEDGDSPDSPMLAAGSKGVSGGAAQSSAQEENCLPALLKIVGEKEDGERLFVEVVVTASDYDGEKRVVKSAETEVVLSASAVNEIAAKDGLAEKTAQTVVLLQSLEQTPIVLRDESGLPQEAYYLDLSMFATSREIAEYAVEHEGEKGIAITLISSHENEEVGK